MLIIAQVRRHNRYIYSIFFNMNVCCVFSLESPHRGDSNEYTQYTIFQYKKENDPNFYQICSCGSFSKELKIEFETAVVNEPSVFEPLNFYCILVQHFVFSLFIHCLLGAIRLHTKNYRTNKNLRGHVFSQKMAASVYLIMQKNGTCKS